MRLRVGLMGLIGVIGCGDPSEESVEESMGDATESTGADIEPYQPEIEGFEPILVDELAVAAADSAQEGDVINESLPAGTRIPLLRYEVPSAPCVRGSGIAVEELPDNATVPGESATFYVAVPEQRPEQGAVAYVPHGNSLEFAESLVVYAANELPGVLDAVGIDPASPGGYGNQLALSFGDAAALSEFDEPRTAGFLEQGFVVVSPGNCWGDLGLGEGEVVRTAEYEAPRYGRVFDTDVLHWTIENHGTLDDFVFADGCSGGGSRIGQQLQHDPAVFDAAVIDSPADDVGGFVREPYGDLIGYAYAIDAEFTTRIMDAYMGAYGGSAEGLAGRSFGHRLGRDVQVDIPILFGYSVDDPLTPPPITGALLEALTDSSRYHNSAGEVIEGEGSVHCQFWRGDPALHERRMQWWDERYAELGLVPR